MKKRTFLLLTFLFMASYIAWAADIQVAGLVDKTQAQVDEEVSFTIRILGTRGNIQAPHLPAFRGFESFYTGRTSQFTFVNGKSNSTVEFNYVLVPKVTGRFTLDPIEVWIEGKRFQTQPIELEVSGPQVAQPQAPQPQALSPRLGMGGAPTYTSAPPASPSAPGPSPAPGPSTGPPPRMVQDDNIFVKASVDKTTAYPNEQILLSYTLFTRYDTRYEGFEEEPSISGFWIEDFPLEKDLGRDTVSLNGKRYVKADIRKSALFPTAPAQYTINPGVLKVSIREQPKNTTLFDDFFDDSFFSGSGLFARRSERLLKPEPIVINVRPFPDKDKPASFNGAVGQFRMTGAADKTEVKQNEPVSVRLVIEGEGNIETLAKPTLPELTAFKIYDGDSSTELYKTSGNLAGKKTFEIIFIPTEAGSLAIPPLQFSYFDPRTEAYQTLQTPAFSLKVTPSNEPLQLPQEVLEREAFKQEVRLETKDIRYIHEEFPTGRGSRIGSFVLGLLAGVNIIGMLWVGAALARRRQEEIFSRDIALKRRITARQIADKRLKNLKKMAHSTNPEEVHRFLGEAEKILSEYLLNKFNASAYHFNRDWLEERLAEKLGAGDDLLEEVREFYERATEARFGRGALPMEEREKFMHLIEEVIKRVEKVR